MNKKPSEILKDIRNGERVERYGICYAFSMQTGANPSLSRAMLASQIYFWDWPHFSGNSTFPIPSLTNASPASKYGRTTKNKWSAKHPYGRLRLDLLDWLIEQFEKAGA